MTDQWFVIHGPQAPHDKYLIKIRVLFFGDAVIAAVSKVAIYRTLRFGYLFPISIPIYRIHTEISEL